MGDAHYELSAQQFVARAYLALGDTARAREIEEDCLRLAREQGNQTLEATSLRSLARFAYYEARFEDALAFLEAGIPIANRHGHRLEFARILYLVAAILGQTERPEAALIVLTFVEALSGEAGIFLDPGELERKEATLAGARGQLDDDAFAAAQAAGRAMTVDEVTELVLSLGEPRG